MRTWSIASLPRDWTTLKASTLPFAESNTVSAEQIGDHRIAYLDCEGPVSGGRGSVRRFDVGTFTIRQQSPERWELDLEGQTLRGLLKLERIGDDDATWQLIYRSAV